METLWVKIEMYKMWFMLTDDMQEFNDLLGYDSDPDDHLTNACAGFDRGKRWFGICLNQPVLEESRRRSEGWGGVEFMATLSHETAHVAAYVMESINDMPRHSGDMEAFCYLQEYLLRLVLRHLGYE